MVYSPTAVSHTDPLLPTSLSSHSHPQTSLDGGCRQFALPEHDDPKHILPDNTALHVCYLRVPECSLTRGWCLHTPRYFLASMLAMASGDGDGGWRQHGSF